MGHETAWPRPAYGQAPAGKPFAPALRSVPRLGIGSRMLLITKVQTSPSENAYTLLIEWEFLKEGDMKDQIKLLGILNIVWGGLSLLGALTVVLTMGGMAAMVASGADADSAAAGPFMAAIGLFVGLFLGIIGLIAIIGGWGLMKFKPWSRIYMIVVSVLHLLSIPIGTALGVFGLIVLLKEQAKTVLDSGGQVPFVPAVPPPMSYPPSYPPPPPPPVGPAPQ